MGFLPFAFGSVADPGGCEPVSLPGDSCSGPGWPAVASEGKKRHKIRSASRAPHVPDGLAQAAVGSPAQGIRRGAFSPHSWLEEGEVEALETELQHVGATEGGQGLGRV